MASYKAVSPYEILNLGGKLDGETGRQLQKCAIYGSDINTWLAAHGCEYNNTTGLIYSNGRVLSIKDIKLTAAQQQQNLTYNFDNWEQPQTLFVRATDKPICYEMRQRIGYDNGGHVNWGGGDLQPVIGGDADRVPIIEVGGVYYEPRVEIGHSVSGGYFWGDEELNGYVPISVVENIVEIDGYYEEYATVIYPEGTVPYLPSHSIEGSKSCFSLGTRIILDFQGKNVRGKYFSFVVGGNEQDVLSYVNTGQVNDHSGMKLGWASATYIGYGTNGLTNDYVGFMNNARYLRRPIRYYDDDENLIIPPYKSVAQVWVTNLGFGVQFNNTTDINEGWFENDDYWWGKEVIVAGYKLDGTIQNNMSDGVWETSGNTSRIIECRNFKME